MKNWIWGFLFCFSSMVVGIFLGREYADNVQLDKKVMSVSIPQVLDSPDCRRMESHHAQQLEALRNDVYQLSQFMLSDNFQMEQNRGYPVEATSGDLSRSVEKNAIEYNSESFEYALVLVRNAEQYNEWTNQDAEDLQESFSKLTKKERFEIMRQLSVAVNKGLLQPQSERFPF